MAPMTRSRSSQPGDVPNSLMATYYGQRASAGLIITEASQISLQGMGYAKTPGVYSKLQIEGWKKTTQTVHEKDGKIFLQLWHVGRVSSSKVNGLQPIAPSALIAHNTKVYVFDGSDDSNAVLIPVEEPKAMTKTDIEHTISDFVQGAKNAIEAGFDGVEIHGANGYLIDEFLRSNTNNRADEYGGNQQNRIRFLIDLTHAVADAIGKDKTGIRLSPFIKHKDMADPEILDTILLAAEELNKLDIVYIHLCEADWDDAPKVPDKYRKILRSKFHNTIIATGNKTPEEGEQLLQENLVDLVGFGRNFISNPDYPLRVKNNLPLTGIKETHTLFGSGDAKGYTDYSNATEY